MGMNNGPHNFSEFIVIKTEALKKLYYIGPRGSGFESALPAPMCGIYVYSEV